MPFISKYGSITNLFLNQLILCAYINIYILVLIYLQLKIYIHMCILENILMFDKNLKLRVSWLGIISRNVSFPLKKKLHFFYFSGGALNDFYQKQGREIVWHL